MKKEYKATSYASDLTDRQWEAIKGFFPVGNKSKYHKRSLAEAVLYILKNKVLRYLVKMTRKKAGRDEEPSYALIHSQSVKTTCLGDNHGYDGGKKQKAGKDTL